MAERQRAEAVLKDSEALYVSLVENLPVQVLRKDLGGKFTFANKSFCRLLHKAPEEILGKNDFDFYPADLASYAVHLARLSWMTAYDAEPLETLRTKAHWQPWLQERGAWIFFEHDAQLPVGRLMLSGSRFEVEPVDWPG